MKKIIALLLFLFPLFSQALEIETSQRNLPTTSSDPQNAWVQINFSTPFSDIPVVIVSPGPSPGGEPFTIRVKDVTPSGFKAQTVEPTGHNGPTHLGVTITYLAVQKGVHGLPDGSFLIAETTETTETTEVADAGTVQVQDFRFDPVTEGEPDIPDSLRSTSDRAELHLLQLIGPVRDEWTAELAGAGVRLLQYYPHNSYLVWADSATMARSTTSARDAYRAAGWFRSGWVGSHTGKSEST